MNIAYMAQSKIPSRTANSIHVMKMCSAFVTEGCDITLIVPESTEIEQDIDNVYKFYGVIENFTVETVKLALPWVSKWRGFRHSLRASKSVKKMDVNIAYGRDLLACCISAILYHNNIFFEAHAPIYSKIDENAFRMLIESKFFKGLVVITEALKQHYVIHYKLNESKIYVAPDGADEIPNNISPAQMVSQSKGMFHVGYIGQLYKGRGIDIIGDIAKQCKFAFFHIVGGVEQDVKMWKEKLNHIENMHFYGYVPHSLTASYGKGMDVLLAPYQNEVYVADSHIYKHSTAQWMSPLKVFEYMSFNKPIICSDMPVLREVLADGINCIMCSPTNVAKWCDAIRILYENKALAKTIANQAFNDFDKYTWKQRAKNIIEFMEQRR